jgi:hypothetical protein
VVCRRRPAKSFVVAFYDALLDGATLGEATVHGRQAALAAGDATWLAYVVYGDPCSRLVRE